MNSEEYIKELNGFKKEAKEAIGKTTWNICMRSFGMVLSLFLCMLTLYLDLYFITIMFWLFFLVGVGLVIESFTYRKSYKEIVERIDRNIANEMQNRRLS